MDMMRLHESVVGVIDRLLEAEVWQPEIVAALMETLELLPLSAQQCHVLQARLPFCAQGVAQADVLSVCKAAFQLLHTHATLHPTCANGLLNAYARLLAAVPDEMLPNVLYLLETALQTSAEQSVFIIDSLFTEAARPLNYIDVALLLVVVSARGEEYYLNAVKHLLTRVTRQQQHVADVERAWTDALAVRGMETRANTILELARMWIAEAPTSQTVSLPLLAEHILVQSMRQLASARGAVLDRVFRGISDHERSSQRLCLAYCHVLELLVDRCVDLFSADSALLDALQEWLRFVVTWPPRIGARVLQCVAPLAHTSLEFVDFALVFLRKISQSSRVGDKLLSVIGVCQLLQRCRGGSHLADTRVQLSLASCLRPAFGLPLGARRVFYALLSEALSQLTTNPSSFVAMEALQLLHDTAQPRLRRLLDPSNALSMARCFDHQDQLVWQRDDVGFLSDCLLRIVCLSARANGSLAGKGQTVRLLGGLANLVLDPEQLLQRLQPSKSPHPLRSGKEEADEDDEDDASRLCPEVMIRLDQRATLLASLAHFIAGALSADGPGSALLLKSANMKPSDGALLAIEMSAFLARLEHAAKSSKAAVANRAALSKASLAAAAASSTMAAALGLPPSKPKTTTADVADAEAESTLSELREQIEGLAPDMPVADTLHALGAAWFFPPTRLFEAKQAASVSLAGALHLTQLLSRHVALLQVQPAPTPPANPGAGSSSSSHQPHTSPLAVDLVSGVMLVQRPALAALFDLTFTRFVQLQPWHMSSVSSSAAAAAAAAVQAASGTSAPAPRLFSTSLSFAHLDKLQALAGSFRSFQSVAAVYFKKDAYADLAHELRAEVLRALTLAQQSWLAHVHGQASSEACPCKQVWLACPTVLQHCKSSCDAVGAFLTASFEKELELSLTSDLVSAYTDALRLFCRCPLKHAPWRAALVSDTWPEPGDLPLALKVVHDALAEYPISQAQIVRALLDLMLSALPLSQALDLAHGIVAKALDAENAELNDLGASVEELQIDETPACRAAVFVLALRFLDRVLATGQAELRAAADKPLQRQVDVLVLLSHVVSATSRVLTDSTSNADDWPPTGVAASRAQFVTVASRAIFTGTLIARHVRKLCSGPARRIPLSVFAGLAELLQSVADVVQFVSNHKQLFGAKKAASLAFKQDKLHAAVAQLIRIRISEATPTVGGERAGWQPIETEWGAALLAAARSGRGPSQHKRAAAVASPPTPQVEGNNERPSRVRRRTETADPSARSSKRTRQPSSDDEEMQVLSTDDDETESEDEADDGARLPLATVLQHLRVVLDKAQDSDSVAAVTVSASGRRRHRKQRVRSRNSYIDAQLVDMDGRDDFADLEDWIVPDDEDED